MVASMDGRTSPGHRPPSTSALEDLRLIYSRASRMSRSVEGRFGSNVQEDRRLPSQKLRQGAQTQSTGGSSSFLQSSVFGSGELRSVYQQQPPTRDSWISEASSGTMSGSGPPPGVPCLGSSWHPQSSSKGGLAWDPRQGPLSEDIPNPAFEQWFFPAHLSSSEPNPRTPQKPLFETPQKLMEPPRQEETNDDITPPKGFNSNLVSRRGGHSDSNLLSSAEGVPRSTTQQRKESIIDKLSLRLSAMNAGAKSIQRQAPETLGEAADFDTLMDNLKLSQPAASTETLNEIRISRPQHKVPIPVSVTWHRKSEPAFRRPGTASEAEKDTRRGSERSNRNGTAQPMPEFGVTSPRFSKEMALCPLDELPNSLRNALLFVSSLPAFPCTGLEGYTPLLPPARTDRPPRPTLVLDLDETLVHCSRSSGSRITPSSIYGRDHLVVQFDDHSSCGYVGFRPFVNMFLKSISRDFEVVVFTASQQTYADKVINALDPAGTLIQHRLYRQHCTEFRGAFFKELHLLGRPLHQCIIVDNSPISAACNWDNSILIKSWYDDQNDRELCDLLRIFREMRIIGGACDHYLVQRYGLRDFFQGLREHVRHAP